jgi:hypothetical protein
MAIFQKAKQEPVNNKPTKPKMLYAIEHLDAANTHMEQAMNVLSSIILDWQKAADFLVGYRNSLIRTMEETGGDVTPTIESQIRDFIPQRHRDEETEEQQKD